jgi:hypothetical protein
MNVVRLAVIKKQKAAHMMNGFKFSSNFSIQILQYFLTHRAHFVMEHGN